MAATRIVSADEHLVEPPEFWDDWLPASLPAGDRDRAPRLEGPALALGGSDDHRLVETFLLFPDLVRHSDEAHGASEPAARVAVLDAEGIDQAMVFPQRAMAMWGMQDRALMVRCFGAYNEWLAARCAATGGRLLGIPILASVHRPEETADQIARIRELGFATMMLPNAVAGVNYADPALDPMWSAIEDAGLPLNFHISEAPDNNGPGGLGSYLAVSFQPFRKLWSFLVFSGILERHPGLRIVFAEGGISWIPSALDHADRIHARFADHLSPRLADPPSHHWFTQCYATFMHDPCGVEQIDRIGAERVMWSSDYPHPEGTFGETAALLDALAATLGEARYRDVVGATAAGLYALDR